jgi:amino-acid N-acetyltransferase
MTGADFVISPLEDADLIPVLRLLAQSGLPDAGFANYVATALVAHSSQKVIGSVALEFYGQSALLRSLAVGDAYQGQGLGQQLTRTALALAQNRHVKQVYLLTETAESFFSRFGFKPVERAAVDPAVQQSVEFTGACPDSAVVMTLKIGG